jgi:K+-sensing histidine kinase KdpD
VQRYRRGVKPERFTWPKLAIAAAVPVAVSAAWVPLREHLPNTDLALVMILVIATVGWVAGPVAPLVSAVTAAVAFDVLDTRPYGTLAMSRGVDITTALILLLTGLLVGAGAARLGRFQRTADHRVDALAVVMEASGLVATGEEQRLVTEAMRAELVRALSLEDCEYHADPPTGTRPVVARDGSLVGLIRGVGRSAEQIDLPVWCQGDVAGHYRLTLGQRKPAQDEMRLALSLADHAGAAMTGLSPPPSPPRDKPARLHLLEATGGQDSGGADQMPTPSGR